MNTPEFRKAFIKAINFVIEYNRDVQDYPVYTNPSTNDVIKRFNEKPPENKENFDEILDKMKTIIVPNLTHWNHPQFYAYFPCGNGYPSSLAEMLICGLGVMGSSWEMCPGLTELELLTCDLMGKLINIPKSLQYEGSHGNGGGTLMNSASEAMYYSMLIARNRTLERITPQGEHSMRYINKLTLYCSEDAHSCIEKNGNLMQVITRKISVDPNRGFQVNIQQMRHEIEKDIALGLIPFYIAAIIGTTGAAAIDDTNGLSQIKVDYPDLWYHIDAAYGGSGLMAPHLSYLLPGLENADSINCNPYKCLVTALDGAVLWVRDRAIFKKYYHNDRKTFKQKYDISPDLADMSMTFTRRLRCLRLYFTLRLYGRKGLEDYTKRHMHLAIRLAKQIKQHPHLILVNRVQLALVCFRMKDLGKYSSKMLTVKLERLVNGSGKIHLIPSEWRKTIFYLRISINYEHATEETVDYGWNVIQENVAALVANPELVVKDPKTTYFIDRIHPKYMSFTETGTEHEDDFSDVFVPNDIEQIEDI